MSTQSAIESADERMTPEPLQYLGTILGCPLLWDDQGHQPVWVEGEPQETRYEPDGSITIEPLFDVYASWWGGPGKRLDCGHVVRRPDVYVTRLAEGRDECLACVGGRS